MTNNTKKRSSPRRQLFVIDEPGAQNITQAKREKEPNPSKTALCPYKEALLAATTTEQHDQRRGRKKDAAAKASEPPLPINSREFPALSTSPPSDESPVQTKKKAKKKKKKSKKSGNNDSTPPVSGNKRQREMHNLVLSSPITKEQRVIRRPQSPDPLASPSLAESSSSSYSLWSGPASPFFSVPSPPTSPSSSAATSASSSSAEEEQSLFYFDFRPYSYPQYPLSPVVPYPMVYHQNAFFLQTVM